MSAFESAIDDSFDTTPQTLEEEESDDVFLFANAYNGPRDGNWAVPSSVGSFVDDRCTTVYGYQSQARPTGRETRIEDGLVKKLMQATIEHKRAEAADRALQNATAVGATNDSGQFLSATPSVRVSRLFFVPPLRNKSHSAVVASHKDRVEQPQKAQSATSQHAKANDQAQPPAPRKTAAPDAEVAKTKSGTPQRSTPNRSTIRILGKNGEEAFVTLPSLPKSANGLSHRTQQRSEMAESINGSRGFAGDFKIQETVIVPEVVMNEKQGQNENQPRKKYRLRDKKKKQNRNEAEQPVAESPHVETEGSQRAVSVVMSGALPAPSREPSKALESVDNSPRDSGIAMSDFVASAKSLSSRTSPVRSGSAISQGVLSIAQQIAKLPSTVSTAMNLNHKSIEGFKEVGLGTTIGFPTQDRISDRSDHQRAEQKTSSRHSSQPSVRRNFGSVQQHDEGKKKDKMCSNYKPPTVVSTSSSASVTHSFDGLYQEGFVPQEHSSLCRQIGGVASHGGGPDQPIRVRSGSVRSRNTIPDAARSKQSQSSSHGSRSDQSMSVRSVRKSFVQSGANYVSDVTSLRQSGSGSHAHQSSQSMSARSDGGSSVRSGASYASGAANYQQRDAGPQATTVAYPMSDRLNQASGARCPSHSPVSPLASSAQLFTPGREKTYYAGCGWISPHPLSMTSSHRGVSPESAVYVSADGMSHCGTLTYSEWRARREALKSVAGSYVGSHVASAVGLQSVPPAAYNHPPPASYVGSHNPGAGQSPQPLQQIDGEPAWVSQHFSPLNGSNTMQPLSLGHSRQGSLQSQVSTNSQSGSFSTAYNNFIENQPVHPAHSAAASPGAGWGFLPQDDCTASGHTPAYNVALTPAELSNYQSQLGDNISRYPSQLSHVQREQTPPQPDYGCL